MEGRRKKFVCGECGGVDTLYWEEIERGMCKFTEGLAGLERERGEFRRRRYVCGVCEVEYPYEVLWGYGINQ